jgi:Tol biopolymer transport system component
LTPTLVTGDVNIGIVQWSPDGHHIAFVTRSNDDTYDLYTAHPDGSSVTLVAPDSDQFPIWSPDGAWLAYKKESATDSDIFISRPDGSESRPIATTSANEYVSGWVEGGARLLVSRLIDETDGTAALDLVSIEDGTTTPFVPAVPGHALGLMGVSPDGMTVVYQDRFAMDESQLVLQPTDSAIPTMISPVFQCDALVCNISFGGWSHDGRQVAYSFIQSYTPNIFTSQLYAADTDGGDHAFRLLDDDGGGAMWLPYSSWLSAYGDHFTELKLYNPRTGVERLLPRSNEGTRLMIQEWHYAP